MVIRFLFRLDLGVGGEELIFFGVWGWSLKCEEDSLWFVIFFLFEDEVCGGFRWVWGMCRLGRWRC